MPFILNFFEEKISSLFIPSIDSKKKKLDFSTQRVSQKKAFSNLDQIFKKPISQGAGNLTKYKNLYQLVLEKDLTNVEQQQIYEFLQKKFRHIEFSPSPQAWVQRADLLDAIDSLVKRYPHLSPLPIGILSSKCKWKQGTVPLIPYNKMDQAIEKLQQLRMNKLRTLNDLFQELKNIVVGEYTSGARVIHHLTKRALWGGKILNLFYRIVTYLLGIFFYHPPFLGKTLDQITHFSQKMGIQSIEILSQKFTRGKKIEQFYYRGPRHLFGHSIHDYQTINDWFIRDLTSEAREEYLNRVRYQESKLESQYGVANKESRIVICNSDARIRLREIQAGEFGQSQILTGKVLNVEAEKQSQIKGDSSVYYEDKYKFTTKNLLGRESDDLMSPNQLNQKQIDEWIKRTSSLDLQNGYVKERETQTLINQAQHELLGCIYRSFNRERVIQVIQRLAPADIHNYVAPLNGTSLSHKEATLFLKEKLKEAFSYLAQNRSLIEEEQQEIKKEMEVYSQLEEVFIHQEKLLGRPSQSTIDIYGTNLSVSTPAIQNQSRILAQNDRKVMLFKHEDESFSLHVFIGATGVNRVNVNPKGRTEKQGERQGDMQFGPDSYSSTPETMTRDGQRKLYIGERKGSFPINGSTVISYYFLHDFTLLPKVKKLTKLAIYGNSEEEIEIEIQSKMGDPLLIKTEIDLVKAFEYFFSHLFKNPFQSDDIFLYLKKISLASIQASSSSSEKLHLLKKLWSGDPLSVSELKLKKRVQYLIEKRLKTLREQEQFSLKLI